MTEYLRLLEKIFPRGLPNAPVQTIVEAVLCGLQVNFEHFDSASDSDLAEIRFHLTQTIWMRQATERSAWVN